MLIAAPTNYDPVKKFFDTHHIEDVIDLVLSVNPDATMVIRSTIPVGCCSLYVKYAEKFKQIPPLESGKRRQFRLLFSPGSYVKIKFSTTTCTIVGYQTMIGANAKKKMKLSARFRVIT